ncbi:MAG: CbbQ/NirQ/NorQ/GpvN family protein [Candidatus Micrarchaeota archaeon]
MADNPGIPGQAQKTQGSITAQNQGVDGVRPASANKTLSGVKPLAEPVLGVKTPAQVANGAPETSSANNKATKRELEYRVLTITKEPWYKPVGREIPVFFFAHKTSKSVALVGPTGCGKTRFVEHMAFRLKKPLVTVSCVEGMNANDLLGKYVLRGNDAMVWEDGPLTKAIKMGGICYLDEAVEGGKDVMVLIHSLTDHRRILPIQKRNQIIMLNENLLVDLVDGTQFSLIGAGNGNAPENFMLAISYNPFYQSLSKQLKPSTRQRFLFMNMSYPKAEVEREIIAHEAHVDDALANKLVEIGAKTRELRNSGDIKEGAGTRLLIYAAELTGEMEKEITKSSRRTYSSQVLRNEALKIACEFAVIQPLTDELDKQDAIRDIVRSIIR